MELSIIIISIISISLTIIFLGLSIFFSNRENKIKNDSIKQVEGKVIGYSIENTRAPKVEYIVDQIKYVKALKYTYVTTTSTPFAPIEAEIKNDILDTKLKVRKNSLVSMERMMSNEFPIGSSMTVFYNPSNPKLAYVERYANSMMSKIFLFSAIFMILTYSFVIFILTAI